MEFNALEIIERIKKIIELKELEKIGISSQVISNWKSRNSIPKADDLYKIANICGCNVEYLLTGIDKTDLTETEKKLISNYRALDESSKHNVDLIVEALSGR